jgi:hypothetical protein
MNPEMRKESEIERDRENRERERERERENGIEGDRREREGERGLDRWWVCAKEVGGAISSGTQVLINCGGPVADPGRTRTSFRWVFCGFDGRTIFGEIFGKPCNLRKKLIY